MKKLDLYIIKKYLGTFFFTMLMIIMISVIFDISEKIEDFIEGQAPLRAIVFQYYLNWIPYFINMFSPLIIFIAVIYFTAKMASNSEIVAILSSGVSFGRMMVPYFISATLLVSLSLYLNHFVIPHANVERIDFKYTYLENPYKHVNRNIHRQISKNNFIYMESYNNNADVGRLFTYEKVDSGKIAFKLQAEYLRWDSLKNKWTLEHYLIREFEGMDEKITKGTTLDTLWNFTPDEFRKNKNSTEAMDYYELKEYIKEEKEKGAEGIEYHEVVMYQRSSLPFSTFILTLLAISVSSRKVRGGIGLPIAFGFLVSFTYILFMQISNTLATNGGIVPAYIAVWIPNIIFGILALILIRLAPK